MKNYPLLTMFAGNLASIKRANFSRQMAVAFTLTVLPLTLQAASFETYVIDTYGGEALLPAVRQQLNSSHDGGTVATYQGKLILQTSAANYQAIQQLLTQIDRQPQALTIAVRVGNNGNSQSNIQQGRVVINNRGIQGSGIINQRNSSEQNNSVYQVQTLSGSSASITTGTLYSLTQHSHANIYSNYPAYQRPMGKITIQQQVLLPTTQGIAVTPRLLTNGQVEVKLSQIEENLVRSNSRYHSSGYTNDSVQGQRLDSTIIVPRGQWVTIGQISQTNQTERSGYARNSTSTMPIALLVQ